MSASEVAESNQPQGLVSPPSLVGAKQLGWDFGSGLQLMPEGGSEGPYCCLAMQVDETVEAALAQGAAELLDPLEHGMRDVRGTHPTGQLQPHVHIWVTPWGSIQILTGCCVTFGHREPRHWQVPSINSSRRPKRSRRHCSGAACLGAAPLPQGLVGCRVRPAQRAAWSPAGPPCCRGCGPRLWRAHCQAPQGRHPQEAQPQALQRLHQGQGQGHEPAPLMAPQQAARQVARGGVATPRPPARVPTAPWPSALSCRALRAWCAPSWAPCLRTAWWT